MKLYSADVTTVQRHKLHLFRCDPFFRGLAASLP